MTREDLALSQPYSTLQLDALRELANIGSVTASAALSTLLGRPVDVSVPNARLVPIAEAVEATGPPESEITGIALGVVGELTATVLLLVPPADAGRLLALLGVGAGDALAPSALREIGNIVGTSYVNALARMTGLDLEPTPPAIATDMLGAIVHTVLAGHASDVDAALLLDSTLEVEDEDCSVSFVLVPDQGGVDLLLDRLGLG
jgi:chemotaxis protein CheC